MGYRYSPSSDGGSCSEPEVLFEEVETNGPEFGEIVPGAFTPVLAKHTKSFNLIDTLAVGVDRIQRNLEPLQQQVELRRKTQVTDERAKLIFYKAFIDVASGQPRFQLVHYSTVQAWCTEFA